MKTANLTGAALDWAVAKCEGNQGERFMQIFTHQSKTGQGYCYSRDWAQGGPIIERERICISSRENKHWKDKKFWSAYIYRWAVHMGKTEEFICCFEADTPLIAAMRCYVASKLGDEVELPEGLTNE